MELDISPIIPDHSDKIREPYNQALTKLLRANDHKIISSYVKYTGSTITIELNLKSDPELVDILQSYKDLKIKDNHNEIVFHPEYPPPPPPIYYENPRRRGISPGRP